MQPESIRKFTLFYLGSLAVWLVTTFLQYDALLAEAEVQMGGANADLGNVAVILSIVAWAAIMLLLWYLVARKGYAIAKWIVVLLFLFNVFTSFGIAAGGLSVPEIVVLVSFALQAVAVFDLFQPDAKAWFSRERDAEASPED